MWVIYTTHFLHYKNGDSNGIRPQPIYMYTMIVTDPVNAKGTVNSLCVLIPFSKHIIIHGFRATKEYTPISYKTFTNQSESPNGHR